jgi:hypothetical protein
MLPNPLVPAPRMAKYAFMFAGIHFPGALAGGYLLEALQAKSNTGLSTALIIAGVTFVGWRFVKIHKRHFEIAERRWLIAGCFLYLVLFEAFVLWAMYDELPPLPPLGWVGVTAITIAWNLAALWLSFRYPVRKMMERRLEKLAKQAA